MIVEATCPRCGTSFYEPHPRKPGRPRRWCSQACRRAASEERRAAANGAIAVAHVPVAVSLDEHVRAVLDSPAACRRVLREVHERAEAGLFRDARWNSVQSEIERLQAKAHSQLRWGRR